MSDLISKSAFNEAMYHEAFETDSDMQKWDSGCWIRYKMFENVLASAPTIDAVEVVRCENCRFSFVNENIDRKPLICGKTKMCGETTPDWFCAAGKRREEEPLKPVWNEEWTRQ